MDPTRITVDLASLEALRGSFRGAAAGIEELREHPGALRARAADTGDGGLAHAVVDLAAAWDWGLELLGGELRRWDALLAVTAAVYQDADRSVRASLR